MTLSECLSGKSNIVIAENKEEEHTITTNHGRKPQKPLVMTPIRLPNDEKISMRPEVSFEDRPTSSDDKFVENSSWWTKPAEQGKLNPDFVCQVREDGEVDSSGESTSESSSEEKSNNIINTISSESEISFLKRKYLSKSN